MTDQRRIVVAVTGAGGTRLAGGFLRKLVADERVGHVDLMVSSNARKIMAFEQGIAESDDPAEVLLGGRSGKVALWDPDVDAAGPGSSGSYHFWGMVVVPCAMGAASRIAHGVANTLIERAADVCLKERRSLVLCIRETPLNLIHLRNLVQLTEAGAVVYPMTPQYYTVPKTLEEMDEGFALRLLGFIGLQQAGVEEWRGVHGSTDGEHPPRT
jgi:4-hydroxy-3-polyprenylbenzoate decarboxylase